MACAVALVGGDRRHAPIDGIVDSKLIKKEADREALYDVITSDPHVVWACAVADAQTVDAINILQATMISMAAAGRAAAGGSPDDGAGKWRWEQKASADHKGCYVVGTGSDGDGSPAVGDAPPPLHFLIDGNRCPEGFPPHASVDAVIGGDGKEYIIGMASILAKVTRDRLMQEYDVLYPEYGLGGHKGYGTAKHRQVIERIGGSPIHRRSFAPWKNMLNKEEK